ncbi:hypothetical protein ACA910_008861 [Epithemia clementina (nom. ined.)]
MCVKPPTSCRNKNAVDAATKRATLVHLHGCCRRWVHHGPSHPNNNRTPWERKAAQVKKTDVTNPYLELIRETHDPSMQIKTLEEELKGTIGKALGKQGQKVLYALQRLQAALREYENLLQQHNNVPNHPAVVQSAQQYNQLRQEAIKARWELMVHRQAVGLIVNNHKYVAQHYPIGDVIPIPDVNNSETTNGQTEESGSSNNRSGGSDPQKPKKVFGDQLSWWQNVGSWR